MCGLALCRFCGSVQNHTFVDLGMMPLANKNLNVYELARMERFYPLHVFVCEACFLVQLPEVESPEYIFSDYPYFSSYSDSWLQHSQDYTEMVIGRFKLNGRSQVVEIGSNDGYLLQYFIKSGIPAFGIEPARNVAKAAIKAGVPTIMSFFGQKAAHKLSVQGKQADLLIGNNVLAHIRVPLANSNVKASELSEMESYYPLHAYVCEGCLLVQLQGRLKVCPSRREIFPVQMSMISMISPELIVRTRAKARTSASGKASWRRDTEPRSVAPRVTTSSTTTIRL